MDVIKNHLSKMFLKEALPLTNKRDVNWSAVKKIAGIAVALSVVTVLLLPSPEEKPQDFYEKTDGGGARVSSENNPTEDTLTQLQTARVNIGSVPGSLDYLYRGGSGGGGISQDRSSSMILAREGLDSKTQLPPGSRISVRLMGRAIVANQPMPVIAIVTKDTIQEDSLAIPQGSKLYGDASFDESSKRALVTWKSIQFPNGREKQLSALAVGADGQVGVEGKVHSDKVKNVIGQTLTRFIGAYAEGSMERGVLGTSKGGEENGLKNAIAETAKGQAESWAEDMKKEREWIELKTDTIFYAIITQSFTFRDPGGLQ